MENDKLKITDEIRIKLRKPMPKEAISQHPTKKFLSTIKAIYVTERLNDVFGIGRWTLTHEVFRETNDYVLMRGKLTLLDYDCEIPEQYGGHTTTGTNTEMADGYKSAVTDIQSKCASYLEIGLEVFKGMKDTPAQPQQATKPAATTQTQTKATAKQQTTKPAPATASQAKSLLWVKIKKATGKTAPTEAEMIQAIADKSGIEIKSKAELTEAMSKSILEFWTD